MEDIQDYVKYCGGTGEMKGSFCESYLRDWTHSNVGGDQSGMVPPNSTTCWGEMQQTTYIDDSRTTFSSLIPFSVLSPFLFFLSLFPPHILSNRFLYAEANQATEMLEALLIYIIAEGLHATTPACNTGGCRGYAHRELWVNISAVPKVPYTIDQFHWIYSEPQTNNAQSSVETGVSDTTTVGCSASFSKDGAGIGFSRSYSFTNSYSDTVQVYDFNVVEDTNPNTGEGKWIFYEEAPVNIQTYPLENFGNDWESWYSNQWFVCSSLSLFLSFAK